MNPDDIINPHTIDPLTIINADPENVEWKSYARAKSTVPAIKALRHRRSLGLKEAKDIVDKYSDLHAAGLIKPSPALTSSFHMLPNGNRIGIHPLPNGEFSVKLETNIGVASNITQAIDMVVAATVANERRPS